jgi:hypothetical protein
MNMGDSGKHKTYSKLSVLIVGKSEPQPSTDWVNQDQLSMELDKLLIATEGLKLQPFYNPLMSR